MNKLWTKEEDLILIENYGNLPNKELGKMLNRTSSGVWKRASKLGLKSDRIKIVKMVKRKYFCNDNYFKNLTIENCYWAGFIAADGWIDRKNGDRKSTRLNSSH